MNSYLRWTSATWPSSTSSPSSKETPPSPPKPKPTLPPVFRGASLRRALREGAALHDALRSGFNFSKEEADVIEKHEKGLPLSKLEEQTLFYAGLKLVP